MTRRMSILGLVSMMLMLGWLSWPSPSGDAVAAAADGTSFTVPAGSSAVTVTGRLVNT